MPWITFTSCMRCDKSVRPGGKKCPHCGYDFKPLNERMDFEHVVHVDTNRIVTDAEGIYAPEVVVDMDADGQVTDEAERALFDRLRTEGWEVMNGYSGQHGYSGPIMHSSEFIGGQMEWDILANPGYYVCMVVDCLGEDEFTDDSPAGWVVLHRPEPETPTTPTEGAPA